MFNRVEYKELAKKQLKGKWRNAVLVTFIYCIITIVLSAISRKFIMGSILQIFITAPLLIGMLITFINLVKNSRGPEINDLFSGFKIYAKSIGIAFWSYLWIFIWSLLFIIPGIIKGIAYSQCYFIIADNPDVKVRDALKISIKMTRGYKMDIFVMMLSFIGWAILCVLTLGIGYLWLTPYMVTSFTNLFYDLKEISIKSGVCSEDEFNGKVSLTY